MLNFFFWFKIKILRKWGYFFEGLNLALGNIEEKLLHLLFSHHHVGRPASPKECSVVKAISKKHLLLDSRVNIC